MRERNGEHKPATKVVVPHAEYQSADERRAMGKTLREATSRAAHGGWKAPKDRRDPIEILQ